MDRKSRPATYFYPPQLSSFDIHCFPHFLLVSSAEASVSGLSTIRLAQMGKHKHEEKRSFCKYQLLFYVLYCFPVCDIGILIFFIVISFLLHFVLSPFLFYWIFFQFFCQLSQGFLPWNVHFGLYQLKY